MGYWEIFDHVSTLTLQHLAHMPMLTYLAELMRWYCTWADASLPVLLSCAHSIPHPPQKNSWGIFSSYTRNLKVHLRESWPACKSIFCLVWSKDFDSKLWEVFVGVTFCTAFKNVLFKKGLMLNFLVPRKKFTLLVVAGPLPDLLVGLPFQARKHPQHVEGARSEQQIWLTLKPRSMNWKK